MKVAALKGGIRRIHVEVPPQEAGGEIEKVWVDYRPGELTLETADQIKAAVSSGFEFEVAEIVLGPILVDWDLENEDGSHLGPEGIKSVPLSFLGLVMAAIQEDVIPNALRDGTSAGSSQLEEQQDPSPNGTGSSEQQTDSHAPPGSSSSSTPPG